MTKTRRSVNRAWHARHSILQLTNFMNFIRYPFWALLAYGGFVFILYFIDAEAIVLITTHSRVAHTLCYWWIPALIVSAICFFTLMIFVRRATCSSYRSGQQNLFLLHNGETTVLIGGLSRIYYFCNWKCEVLNSRQSVELYQVYYYQEQIYQATFTLKWDILPEKLTAEGKNLLLNVYILKNLRLKHELHKWLRTILHQDDEDLRLQQSELDANPFGFQNLQISDAEIIIEPESNIYIL